MPPRLTAEEAKANIKAVRSDCELIQYDGYVNSKKSIFLDFEYGEFPGRYVDVLKGQKNHPERSKLQRIQNLKNPETRKKIEKTNEAKYGGSTPFHNKEIQRQAKETQKENWGVDNISRHPDIKKKKEETCLKNYGVANPSQSEEICDKKEETLVSNNNMFRYKNKTAKDWAEEIDISHSYVTEIVRKFGAEVLDEYKKFEYKTEKIIKIILASLNIPDSLIIHNKPLVGYSGFLKIQPDFHIKSPHNIVIEMDGLYFHSSTYERDPKNVDYHISRRKQYDREYKNYLFFRDNEIYNKKHILNNLISNKLLFNKPVDLFECEIKPIDQNLGSNFMENNYLLNSKSDKYIGIYLKDELIGCISYILHKDTLTITDICEKIGFYFIEIDLTYYCLAHFLKQNFTLNKVQLLHNHRLGNGKNFIDINCEIIKEFINYEWTNFKKVLSKKDFLKISKEDQSKYTKIFDYGNTLYSLPVNFLNSTYYQLKDIYN